MTGRLLYALFMLLALLVFVLARHWLPRHAAVARLPGRQRFALALAAFIGGSLGSKLPFLLGSAGSWYTPTAWAADGKTITTALVSAYLAVEVVKWALGIRVKTGDSFALPLALALAVGRWGCFFNGCCAGVASDLPWAVDFGDGVPRHPTQVYESVFHLAMAGVLGVLLLRGWCRHLRLQMYLVCYGGYRFGTEFIRPEPPWWLGLTFYQWVALLLVVGLVGQWMYERPTTAELASACASS